MDGREPRSAAAPGGAALTETLPGGRSAPLSAEAVCAASQEGRGAQGVGASLGTMGSRAGARTAASPRTGPGTLVPIRAGDPSPRSGARDHRPDMGPGTLIQNQAGDPRPEPRPGTLLQIQARDLPLGRWSLMPGGSASRPGLPFCSARRVSRLTYRSSLALRYFQFVRTKHTCPNQLCKKEGIESHLKVKSRSAVL